MIDAAKRAIGQEHCGRHPHFGWARQDRKDKRVPLSRSWWPTC